MAESTLLFGALPVAAVVDVFEADATMYGRYTALRMAPESRLAQRLAEFVAYCIQFNADGNEAVDRFEEYRDVVGPGSWFEQSGEDTFAVEDAPNFLDTDQVSWRRVSRSR